MNTPKLLLAALVACGPVCAWYDTIYGNSYNLFEPYSIYNISAAR